MSCLNFQISVAEYSDSFFNLIPDLNLEKPSQESTVDQKKYQKVIKLPQTSMKWIYFDLNENTYCQKSEVWKMELKIKEMWCKCATMRYISKGEVYESAV